MAAYSDEIDLRAYIDILWRWRWFIVAVTVVAALCAGLLSFFVLQPVYETATQIMVPKDPVPSEVILSPHFMQIIISKLGLSEDKYTPFTISKNITVEPSKASASLTTIRVRNGDPLVAQKIADAIASEFLAFVRDKNMEAISSSVSYLNTQKSTATSQLAKQRAERDALRQSGRIERLQMEVNRVSSRLNDFRSMLASGQIREKELTKGIAELQSSLATTPKTLAGPPDWSGHATEIPNDSYLKLEQTIAYKKVELSELQVRLAEVESELPSLDAEYGSLYSQLLSLQRQLQDLDTNIAELTGEIGALESRINALSINLPQTSVITPAVTPKEPVAPRKLLNVAVATVLGGFVAVFAVFFIEYWRSPRKDVPAF